MEAREPEAVVEAREFAKRALFLLFPLKGAVLQSGWLGKFERYAPRVGCRTTQRVPLID